QEGPLLNLIRKMLSPNRLAVFDGLQLSAEILQRIGVLQGDTLSPILFIMASSFIINFIKNEVPDIQIVMYADDLLLFSNSIEVVQQALTALALTCSETNLAVNTLKSKAVKFRRGGRLS